MKYKFVGKNIEVGDRLKNRLKKKVGKLEKYFAPDTEAVAAFGILKNWHILELTIVQNGITFRAEERTDDMFMSIDAAVDVIERQIRKNKTRLSRRIHETAFRGEAADDWDVEDASYIVEEPEYSVVRNKKFKVAPMSVEEAILQMNLLGHEFFVFMNSETKLVSVVYRRRDESYGLIEPEY